MDVEMKSSLDDLIKKDKKFLRKKRPGQQGKANEPRRFKNKGAAIFKTKNAGGRPDKRPSSTGKGAALKAKSPLKRFGNRAARPVVKSSGAARTFSKGDRKQRLQDKLDRRQNKKEFRVQGKGPRGQAQRNERS